MPETYSDYDHPPEIRRLIRLGYTSHDPSCVIIYHYFDRNGYAHDGYNREGYDREGYNREGYNREGYNREGYNRDGYDRYGNPEDPCVECSGCADCDPYGGYRPTQTDPDYDRSGLRYYSYTPSLVFRGDSAPYYGMEIEVTTDKVGALTRIVNRYAPDLIYCKEDSSVDGAEMVTHPMSYEWAMANFPWDLLPTLKDEADATIVGSENGIHVHVGRDGFTDSAHLLRWMKLWYRNPMDIQRIARRRSSHWGGFSPSHRAAQKEHAKYGKPHYNFEADETRQERYAAINTSNSETLEVRVFASTLRPRRAQAALQLVAGSVEYTRQLTSEAILHRRGWEWRAFMAWIQKSGKYTALVSEDRTRR